MQNYSDINYWMYKIFGMKFLYKFYAYTCIQWCNVNIKVVHVCIQWTQIIVASQTC